MLSASTLLAFANLLNDNNDRRLDRLKNKDGAPVGSFPIRTSWNLSIFFLSISVLSAGIAIIIGRTYVTGILYGSALILVILYEWRFKDMGLPGNIAVGVLSGSLFLFGGSLNVIDPLTTCITMASALASTAREIIKDIEDMKADSVFRITLPLRLGTSKAAFFAVGSSCLILPVSLYPMISGEGNMIYLVLVLLASAFIIGPSVRTYLDASSARESQNVIKIAMVVSMASYVSLFIL
jgi:geranylgeranylglycerol-phosphate geranylgeranyltransferase